MYACFCDNIYSSGSLSLVSCIMQQVFLIPVESSETIRCSGKDGGSFLWKRHEFMIILPPDCADEIVTINIKAYYQLVHKVPLLLVQYLM